MSPFTPNPALRVALRASVVLVAAALSAACFGLVVPFTLLALRVLPSLSVGGVIYVAVGGLFGLVFGAWSAAASLARSPRLVSPYCVTLIAAMTAANAAALVAARYFDAFAHV